MAELGKSKTKIDSLDAAVTSAPIDEVEDRREDLLLGIEQLKDACEEDFISPLEKSRESN